MSQQQTPKRVSIQEPQPTAHESLVASRINALLSSANSSTSSQKPPAPKRPAATAAGQQKGADDVDTTTAGGAADANNTAGEAAAAPPTVTVPFTGIESFERWGVEPAAGLLRAISACILVQEEYTRYATRVKAAVTGTGVDYATASGRPGTSAARDIPAADLIMSRLREDAQRLRTVAVVVRLCAPFRGGAMQSVSPPPSRRGAAGSSGVAADGDGGAPPFAALWPLVAKRVKNDVAILTSHLQLDTACLHALMLPTVDVGQHDHAMIRAAVAGVGVAAAAAIAGAARAEPSDATPLLVLDDTQLPDDDSWMVQQVCTAFDMFPAQFLHQCQDALALVLSTSDYRARLDATTLVDRAAAGVSSASSGFLLRSTPTALADGTGEALLDTLPDAHLSEENSHYAMVLKRHANPSVASFGAAVGRNEALSSAQVDLINGPLADAVVGVMHSYNVLVATFSDYRREAARYHRVARARKALNALSAEHASGQVAAVARELALMVGESVNAIDSLVQDVEALAQWATSCAGDVGPNSVASNVGHKKVCRVAYDVVEALHTVVEILATLLETCRLALVEHCRPILDNVTHCLEVHTAALLPLAQATSAVVTELRHIDSTLTRELSHLRARLRPSVSGERDAAENARLVAQSLLRPLSDLEASAGPTHQPHGASSSTSGGAASNGDGAVDDPLVNPAAISAAAVAKRASIIAVIAGNAKHAIMQLPPTLAGLLRVLNSQTSMRHADSRLASVDFSPSMHAALTVEVANLDATLDEALVSLRKYAPSRTVAAKAHVTPASLRAGIQAVVDAFSSSNSAALPSDSPRRGSSGAPTLLSTDQALTVALMCNLVDLLDQTEQAVVAVASENFATDSDAPLVAALEKFTAFVSFVESLGEAIYLDVEALKRIGMAPVISSTALR